jgi:hypothetical protein
MASALADDVAKIRLRIAVIVDKLLESQRFLHRIEIGTLDVLDDRQFQRLAIADIADDRRYLSHSSKLGRPPASLAGDDLVTAAGPGAPHDHRLHDPMLADRLAEIGQFFVREASTRIARVGRYQLDRQSAIGGHGRRRRGGRLVHVADQRRKTSP